MGVSEKKGGARLRGARQKEPQPKSAGVLKVVGVEELESSTS